MKKKMTVNNMINGNEIFFTQTINHYPKLDTNV